MIAIVAVAAIAILSFLPDTRKVPSEAPTPSAVAPSENSAALQQESISRHLAVSGQAKTVGNPLPVDVEPDDIIETGWIYGNVIDLANSEMVGGAKILLDTEIKGNVGISSSSFETTTQEDGSFRMEVPTGKWRASLRIPSKHSTSNVYWGDPPRMVHGSVEIFTNQETPFSFLVDSSTSLAGAIFEKETPEYTSLSMELVRIQDQSVVAIHHLFADSHWQAMMKGPEGEAIKNPNPPNHGGFLFEFLEPGLYEIRVSLIFVEPPSKPTYWSYQVDLVSGNADIGKHALTFQDLMGRGN
jgi:hypothetical protein